MTRSADEGLRSWVLTAAGAALGTAIPMPSATDPAKVVSMFTNEKHDAALHVRE